ncbi:hypothetical protein L9F63_016529, partial [Diploptera punctata]
CYLIKSYSSKEAEKLIIYIYIYIYIYIELSNVISLSLSLSCRMFALFMRYTPSSVEESSISDHYRCKSSFKRKSQK